jgi:XapX domain-containing protein
MKFLVGLIISFLVGAGCRYFDLPVGSPAVVPGALLVLAMTLGYSSTDRLMSKQRDRFSERHCGRLGTQGVVSELFLMGLSNRRFIEKPLVMKLGEASLVSGLRSVAG